MNNVIWSFYDRVRPKKLLDLVSAIIVILVVILMISSGGIFSGLMSDIVRHQTEARAIQAAKHVALIPEIQRFVSNHSGLESVHQLVKTIRKEIGSQLVVIANREGIIISHPDSSRIGQAIDDPLSVRALRYGRAYNPIDYRDETIRGVAPVINSSYQIIGLVSVGFPIRNIKKVTEQYLEKGVFFIFLFITLGLIAAILIANGVKRAIFGLEPSEIAYMFQERSAMIESTREGIIAADHTGKISLINEAALKTLSITEKEALSGMSLPDIFPFIDATDDDERIHDKECVIKGVPLIVNVSPIGKQHGLVVTFRERRDIDIIARELSQVQTYSEMLRAQTHEYSNNLHTMVGMIQIGAYDDLLNFIGEETRGHRNLIRFLTENVPDRILSSLIIGKYLYANEQKVDLIIDSESRMIDIPDSIDRYMLSTAWGNVIQNAVEASLTTKPPHVVTLFMSDYGTDLIFEVEDSGAGIPAETEDRIFEKGVSTKSGYQRGIGLYLAKKSIETLGGTIYFDRLEQGGCRFEIVIPKGESIK